MNRQYTKGYYNRTYREIKKAEEAPKSGIPGFLLRLLFCMILFIGFFYLDMSGESVYGFDAGKILSMTNQNINLSESDLFRSNSFDFTEKFPYTLIDNQNDIY